MLWHKVAQKQVDGILLFCISVGVAIEATNGCDEVSALGGSLPVTPLALEKHGMGFRATVLQAATLSFTPSDRRWYEHREEEQLA